MPAVKENIHDGKQISELKSWYLYISKSISILDEAVEKLRRTLRGKINFETDFKIFYGGPDMDENDFKNFTNTPSFFSEKRAAVVKSLEKASAEFIKTLIRMCSETEQGDDSILIILTYATGDRKEKNIADLKTAVSKSGIVEVLYAPTSEKLGRWLAERSELDGVKFTQKAVSRFIENVGFDLSLLKSEYEKLMIYLISEKEKTINETTVDKLVPRVYDMKIFDLVNCIGNRDRTGALKTLKSLMLEKQNMIGVIALLYRMFSAFIYIKSENLKKQAQIYPGYAGSYKTPGMNLSGSFRDYIEKSIGHTKNKEKIAASYLRFSQKYSLHEIIKVFDILNSYDILLRSAEINEAVLITRLIAEIIGIKA